MKIIISPSKSMQFKDRFTSEVYPDDSYKRIHNKLKKLSKNNLGAAFGIKGNILDQTYFNIRNNDDLESNTAIRAYTGFVYKGLNLELYSKDEWNYLNDNLIIISAYYGLLKPETMIKPYRLDYKAKIGMDLYKYRDFSFDETVINLASEEFSKAVQSPMITIGFREEVKGKFVNKPTYSKQARGVLLDYLIKNQVNTPEDIKGFSELDYKFNSELSDNNNIIFTR